MPFTQWLDARRYLDERIAKLVGGSLFLVFAAATIWDIYSGAQ